MDGAPAYGRQLVRVWDGSILIDETIETVQAAEGETPEAFILRVAQEMGLGPTDPFEVHYQGGRPTIALLKR